MHLVLCRSCPQTFVIECKALAAYPGGSQLKRSASNGVKAAESIWLEPYTEAAKINLGRERSVSIYVESCWEVGRAVYYEVREAGKEIVPRTFLGSDDGHDRYTLTAVSAEDQSLFGIFGPTKSADRLFIMIDFKTGKPWPRLLGEVPYNEYDKAKQQASDLFDRLQRENPAITGPEGLSP